MIVWCHIILKAMHGDSTKIWNCPLLIPIQVSALSLRLLTFLSIRYYKLNASCQDSLMWNRFFLELQNGCRLHFDRRNWPTLNCGCHWVLQHFDVLLCIQHLWCLNINKQCIYFKLWILVKAIYKNLFFFKLLCHLLTLNHFHQYFFF